MSFKRDGDDASQLNVLKKRRVAELLASYIPEDEALLLKNGRYACTVCHHRPVFDTIEILTVHRRGKKHIACMQRFYGKKAAHRNEVQKRQHEHYVQAEEAGEQHPAPLLEQTKKITQHALLKAAPYNSCCTRNRAGDVRRTSSSSKVEELPQSVSSPQSSGSGTTCPNQPTVTTAAETSRPDQPTVTTAAETSRPEPRSSSTDIRKKKNSKSKNKTPKSSEKCEDPADDPERRRVMEHYLSLRSSGWIPDGTGKWVKDENVEFDSDEEEPPGIAPP